jgi:hypothetical protein
VVIPPVVEAAQPSTWSYGSTRDDVLRIEGEPDRGFVAGSREIWFYRRTTRHGFPVESQVRFDQQGRVEAWVDANQTLHAVGNGLPRPRWRRH